MELTIQQHDTIKKILASFSISSAIKKKVLGFREDCRSYNYLKGCQENYDSFYALKAG